MAGRVWAGSLCVAAVLLLGACRAETDRALYGAGDHGATTFENGHSESVLVDCTVHLDRAEDGEWVEQETQVLGGCGFLFPPLPLPPIEPFPTLPDLPLVPLNRDPFDGFAGGFTLVAPESDPSPLSLESHETNVTLIAPIPVQLADARRIGPGESLLSSFRNPEDPGEWRIRYDVGFGCPESESPAVDACVIQHSVETNAFGVEEFCPVEECEEEAPFCAPPFPDPILPGTRPPPVVSLPPGSVRDPRGAAGIFFPIGVPLPECRRDLDTGACRWVCDDARPIPPDTGY